MAQWLRGGSTRLKITWVQQRQHHSARESARERMLSLALRARTTSQASGFKSRQTPMNFSMCFSASPGGSEPTLNR